MKIVWNKNVCVAVVKNGRAWKSLYMHKGRTDRVSLFNDSHPGDLGYGYCDASLGSGLTLARVQKSDFDILHEASTELFGHISTHQDSTGVDGWAVIKQLCGLIEQESSILVEQAKALFPLPDPDEDLTASELAGKYGVGGGEHPRVTRLDWRVAVASQSTSQGYWEYVEKALDVLGPEEG